MQRRRYEKDSFRGENGRILRRVLENKKETNSAIIAMLGDDAEDYMAKSCVKWLMKKGVNVLTMSPGKKNYSHHNYPLERIEKAIEWLKNNGNKK